MPCSLEIKWRPLAAAMGTKWDLRLQKVFWKILSLEGRPRGGGGYPFKGKLGILNPSLIMILLP